MPRTNKTLVLLLTFYVQVLLVTQAGTFTDANWLSMGGYAGANADVRAIVEDSFGNVIVGGSFTAIGDAPAHGVARWDGRKWTSLGSGLDGEVHALALLGTNIYAGGNFKIPGSSEF